MLPFEDRTERSIMDLATFRDVGPRTPTTIIYIPEKKENRKLTDKYYMIVYLVVVSIAVLLLLYTLLYSDYRLLFGADSCGNFCGYKNRKYYRWDCTGQDFTNKKYLKEIKPKKNYFNDLYDRDDSDSDSKKKVREECVADCGSNYHAVRWRCYKNEDQDPHYSFMDIQAHLTTANVIIRLIICSFIPVGLSIMMLYVLKSAVQCVVWTSIIVNTFLSCIVAMVAWYYAFKRYDDKDINMGLAAIALVATIAVIIYVIYMFLARNKIKVFALILIEATYAIMDMPCLIMIPVITFLVVVVLLAITIVLTIYLWLTAGHLTETEPGLLEYEKDFIMYIALIFNFLTVFWTFLTISGFQYLVIGGAVSDWYFAKDKDNLRHPIRRSTSIACRYHIGTVVCGSLILVGGSLISALVKAGTRTVTNSAIPGATLTPMEQLMATITQTAYVMTAMHGQSFLKSGKRAIMLVVHNIFNLLAISNIGEVTLYSIMTVITLSSMVFSLAVFLVGRPYETYEFWMILIAMCIYACCVACLFISVFDTTIDVIFLCFCEDRLLNDGSRAHPYAMSQELMEVMEMSKPIFGQNERGS